MSVNQRMRVAIGMAVVFGSMPFASASSPTAARDELATLLQLPATQTPGSAVTQPSRTCESLLTVHLSNGATVRDAQLKQHAGAESCQVTVEIQSRAPAGRPISVWVMLPIEHWNGRFLGLGGGGWVPGFPGALGAGAARGFATAITNAGRPYELTVDPAELGRQVGQDDFLIDGHGRLDWSTLQDFAYRGIHEMTVAGKAVAREFYGTAARYAYFSGCSTGGRQGQSEVQRYPKDYDGVLSGAPAINWAHFGAAQSWPLAVIQHLHPVSQCKFEAAHAAAIEACDADDGARDRLIAATGTCQFDARQLVGRDTSCGVIDPEDAEVIQLIWQGPHRRDGSALWNGVDRAALIHPPVSPEFWATPFADGRPFPLSSPSFADFETPFDEFVERYGAVMDTANPDVRAFARGGGKTLLWHGVADDVIPAAGTAHYVESIRHALGIRDTEEFLRLYLAPGVGHCQGGDGPQPVALLEPLMQWVEHGKAPGVLRSETVDESGQVTRTRPLCPYPQRPRYRGSGSLNDAGSFRCKN